MRNGEFSRKLYLKQSQRWEQQEELDRANSTGLPIPNDGFTYGHVFFRQQKDSEIRRGFFQKAVVILTPHSWPGLFHFMISILGPHIMDTLVSNRKNGDSEIQKILESVCFEIASWPSPPTYWSFDIGFHQVSVPITLFGKAYPVLFPPHNHFPQVYELKQRSQTLEEFQKPVLCSPPRFYQLFNQNLNYLWTCWELMMLGEPIVCMSETPNACSDVVLALVELIKPIPFGGDYRPYFTIQDSDCPSIANKSRSPPPAVVLGITNRVFSKVLEKWPHCIHTGKTRKQDPEIDDTIRNAEQESVYFVENFTSKHRPYFSKDKKLLKDIFSAGVNVKGVDAINNMIRQHFVELTQRFLQPLNRYFDSLVVGNPATMNLSCLRLEPEMKPFRHDQFLKIPSLPLIPKRPIVDFYRAFIKSPNFASWLQSKMNDTYRNWRYHYLQVLCKSDIEGFIHSHLSDSLVEGIDLLMRYRDELAKYASFFSVEGSQVKLAYISVKPPEIEQPKPVVPKETPIIPPNQMDLMELEEEGGIDLASIGGSPALKRHIRNRTAPLPERSYSPCPDSPRATPTIRESATLKSEFQHTNPSQFLETLKQKRNKSLCNLGQFIPTVEQYGQLINQLDVVLSLLPKELSQNY